MTLSQGQVRGSVKIWFFAHIAAYLAFCWYPVAIIYLHVLDKRISWLCSLFMRLIYLKVRVMGVGGVTERDLSAYSHPKWT